MSDDEISIDFSKITKIFSGKSKKPKKKDKRTSKKNNSKQSSGHEEQHEVHFEQKQEKKEGSDEISIDFKKAKKFIIKNYIYFLILIPIILTVIIRIQPNYLPITNGWAKNTADNYFKNQIRTQIDAQYPSLPEENKLKLIDENYKVYYKQNEPQIKAQIKGLSQQYKSYFKDDLGYTYLSDIDSYTWLRQAKNIQEKGTVADKIVNGTLINDHMNAPIGALTGSNIHPYAIAYLQPILRIFDSNITLMQTSFYIPILVAILSTIFAFLIGRRIAGNAGGFFTSLVLAINPMFISRTFGSDNDIWNVFFPLLILWLFLDAFEKNSRKQRIIFASLAGAANGIYAFAWGGWWYTFDVLLATLGVFFIYYLVTDRTQLKVWFEITIPFIFFAGLFVTFIESFKMFILSPLSPLSFVTIKNAAHATLWPNVYTTVAELNPGNFSSVVANLGGKLNMTIALLGLILTLFKKDDRGKYNIRHAALVLIWFSGTLYASYKGVRFIFLMIPVFAVAFGISFGLIYKFVSKWISKELSLNEKISKVFVIFALLLFLFNPVKIAFATGKNLVPTMNDPWYQTLTEIKEKSEPDAILNSWWDFGHWFKYLADRRVTFDGASQNSPQAHWIGKVLLTDDENLAIGILRMLDCGANNAFEMINKKVNNTRKSVSLIYELLEKKGNETELLKNNGFNEQEIKGVLQYMLCKAPEDYFIASDDMIGKSGVWAHFGSWDFERAEIWVKLKKMPKQEAVAYMVSEYGYDTEKAESVYDEVSMISDESFANSWIAPWPNYVSGKGPCTQQLNNLYCQNQVGNQPVSVNISLKTKLAIIPSSKGNLYPASLTYLENNKTVELKNENSTFPYSVILIKKGDTYTNIWSQPQLANSMFTRMFFYEGAGLEKFKLFSHHSGMTGTNIYVYSVDWGK